MEAFSVLVMSLTIQQILLDAKKLSDKLKEHDTAADALLSQTQSVYKQIDAMKHVSCIFVRRFMSKHFLVMFLFVLVCR